MNENVDAPLPILVWTRFSLVNKNVDAGAWKIGRGMDTDEYIHSVVEDEGRLRPRAKIVFRHTLPNIDAMYHKDSAIRHVAAASDRLPRWLLSRLDEATERYPWLYVHKVEYDDDWRWEAGLRPALLSIATECFSDVFLVASCRLDDDDVLAPAFSHAVREYIKPQYRDFCVSFTRGYCGLWDKKKSIYELFLEWKYPMGALGLAYIGEYDARNLRWVTPYWGPPGNHMKVDEKVPVILDGRMRLYIRNFHNSNDVNTRPFFVRSILGRAYRDRTQKLLRKNQVAAIMDVREAFVTV